ncbi:MAG: N-acetyl-gamma-glutamyl-phosphate reductase [Acidimicrobiales bacterium]
MKVGVVGATGYLGAELLRLLADHPALDVAVAQGGSGSGSGAHLGELLPSLAAAYPDLVVGATSTDLLDGLDVVFVATPAGSSQEVVASLGGRTRLLVDLGADFRLNDPASYRTWYGFEHAHPEMLQRFVYGLPELFREELTAARLVSSPGCYVTAASLALAPLVRDGLIERSGIVVDAASGTSGAGKSPSSALHHPLVNERFTAYGVLTHRHTPEMEQVLGVELLFTPHLAPMTRGILATCYARPARDGEAARCSTAQLIEVLAAAYRHDPFVHVTTELPSTADAYGSNVCHLTARFDERTGWIVLFSALDNLLKGGSGQAIQAANLALGLPETAGLPLVAMSP